MLWTSLFNSGRKTLLPNPSTNLASGQERSCYMLRNRLIFAAVIVASIVFLLGSASASASSTVLKKEMQGSEVTSLQKDLKKLGYLSVEPTGYFGDATVEAVKKLQDEYGYDPDGIVGSTTFSLIDRMLGRNLDVKTASGDNKQETAVLLKEGMDGSTVTALQKNLVKLGFLTAAPTGHFGEATAAAVVKLQKKYGYQPDGMAGSGTQALIAKLINEKTSATAAKTEVKAVATTEATAAVKTEVKTGTKADSTTNYKLPWSKASKIFAIGTIATVYDIKTGLSFKVKRTFGHNHADSETLTSKDTATMKKIYGGEWSWDRRAVIITVGDVKIAASMAGMPHAGSDKYAANRYISSRSGGYGRGENLDAVKGNSMSGHFDIHFYGSRTHGTNKIDSKHQSMVRKATEWAKKNL
ncbi:MAG: peptidoglycan-binding protein [Ruminiclostridium sp.]|nr:peptidoglycan-binding protein [Ruminiclostridium sp.]